MAQRTEHTEFRLTPADNTRLANLCGRLDEHLKQIEGHLGVAIVNRGNDFRITGAVAQVQGAAGLIRSLYDATASNPHLTPAHVRMALKQWDNDGVTGLQPDAVEDAETQLRTPKCVVRPRSARQRDYVRAILTHDIAFGVGPAGTGKTWLAVACAVDALERDEVRRIVLVRPAVEAGERLGFLPGALEQKVDPYLRPLYDALYEMLGAERVVRSLEKSVIELAPLAYMRGRTLNESFVILDEAQNTSIEQMKMFLTRIGYSSRAVITGDITQVDLPRGTRSGLRDAIEILDGIPGISFTHFLPADVMRNPLVQRIVEAYDARASGDPTGSGSGPE